MGCVGCLELVVVLMISLLHDLHDPYSMARKIIRPYQHEGDLLDLAFEYRLVVVHLIVAGMVRLVHWLMLLHW